MKLGDVRPGQETKMLPCQPTTEIKKNIYIYIYFRIRIQNSPKNVCHNYRLRPYLRSQVRSIYSDGKRDIM